MSNLISKQDLPMCDLISVLISYQDMAVQLTWRQRQGEYYYKKYGTMAILEELQIC